MTSFHDNVDVTAIQFFSPIQSIEQMFDCGRTVTPQTSYSPSISTDERLREHVGHLPNAFALATDNHCCYHQIHEQRSIPALLETSFV
jgi:hypothetical protein